MIPGGHRRYGQTPHRHWWGCVERTAAVCAHRPGWLPSSRAYSSSRLLHGSSPHWTPRTRWVTSSARSGWFWSLSSDSWAGRRRGGVGLVAALRPPEGGSAHAACTRWTVPSPNVNSPRRAACAARSVASRGTRRISPPPGRARAPSIDKLSRLQPEVSLVDWTQLPPANNPGR